MCPTCGQHVPHPKKLDADLGAQVADLLLDLPGREEAREHVLALRLPAQPEGHPEEPQRRLLHCEGSGKLDRARSRLYRRQILQVNMRLKALAEIYTMHSFAPFFNLKISAKNRQHFSRLKN